MKAVVASKYVMADRYYIIERAGNQKQDDQRQERDDNCFVKFLDGFDYRGHGWTPGYVLENAKHGLLKTVRCSSAALATAFISSESWNAYIWPQRICRWRPFPILSKRYLWRPSGAKAELTMKLVSYLIHASHDLDHPA